MGVEKTDFIAFCFINRHMKPYPDYLTANVPTACDMIFSYA